MKLSEYRIKKVKPGEIEYKAYLFLLLTFVDKRCFLPLAQDISDFMSDSDIYQDSMDLAFRGVKDLSLDQVMLILSAFDILPKHLYYYSDDSNANYKSRNIDLRSSDLDNLLDFLPVFYDAVSEVSLEGGKILVCYTAGGQLLDVISEEGKKLEIYADDNEKIGWHESGYFNSCLIAHDKRSILLLFLGRMTAGVQYHYENKKFSIKTGESELSKFKLPRNFYAISDIEKVFKARQKRNQKQSFGPLSVIIGHQEWMTTNLNTSTFSNGDLIQEATTIQEWEDAGLSQQPAWCYYQNNPELGEKYGKLYNWYAVSDPRGLAPAGWHIPSLDEWQQLNDFLNDNVNAKLQAGIVWEYDNTLDLLFSKSPGPIKKFKKSKFQNASGFSALPGGSRGEHGNVFFAQGDSAYWWASTPKSEALDYEVRENKSFNKNVEDEYAHIILLYVMDTELQIGNYVAKKAGLSVRCIKNSLNL
jgi:uncharacterized protein (TIGR02145 family)